MKLTRVDHVQPWFAHRAKSRQDLFFKARHSFRISLVSSVVKIQVPAYQAIWNSGKPPQRILNAISKELPAEHPVVDWNSQSELRVELGSALPELPVVPPASEEK